MSPRSPRIGLLGKLPGEADYVRVQASSPLAFALHRWLEAGLARGALPARARFLLSLPGEREALVGALVPSSDSVGRAFPLACFATLPCAELATRLALLPAAMDAFWSEGLALQARATEQSAQALLQGLEAAPLPEAPDFARAEAGQREALSRATCRELLAPLPGEGAEPRCYALHTFLTGCRGERHRQGAAPGVILDCPLSPGLGPMPWLELAARLLDWRATPPAFVWTDGPTPRLLLALGTAHTALLATLVRPGGSGPSVWALHTSREAAHRAARETLSAPQRAVLDAPDAPLTELLRVFAR